MLTSITPLTRQTVGIAKASLSVKSLAQLWRQVRVSRGTPELEAAHLAVFVEGLSALERDKLESVLTLVAWGREQPDDFSLISWAASYAPCAADPTGGARSGVYGFYAVFMRFGAS